MTNAIDDTGPAKPYHHGRLRRALIDAALAAIAESGPEAISLRALARALGVSHAAPAHHFGDKAGLLTVIAAEGYREMAETLRDTYERTSSFLEVGVAYVRFALEHRAYVDVMFRPDLCRVDDLELIAAKNASRAMLYGPVDEVQGRAPGVDTLQAGVAAWSLMHGFAQLWATGNLPSELGDDPEAAARAIAAYLFRPSA